MEADSAEATAAGASDVQSNASMPDDVLVPVLAYPDVQEAVDELGRVFGFRLRWMVGDHRAQLAVGDSAAIAVIVGERAASADHIMVRVDDAEAHRGLAEAAGCRVSPLEEYPYGERQYTAVDFSGRSWVFTESVTDVDPRAWGAETA